MCDQKTEVAALFRRYFKTGDGTNTFCITPAAGPLYMAFDVVARRDICPSISRNDEIKSVVYQFKDRELHFFSGCMGSTEGVGVKLGPAGYPRLVQSFGAYIPNELPKKKECVHDSGTSLVLNRDHHDDEERG
jgi:hypothetical protein